MKVPAGYDQVMRLERFRAKHSDVMVAAPPVNPGIPKQWVASRNNKLITTCHDLEMLLDSLEGMEL